MDISTLQKCLLPVFRQYRIRKAILFGSFARGEQSRHSDVDLILIQKTSQPFFQRYDGLLAGLNNALPGLTVEALIYTPDELEQIAHRPFIARALREGKILYESE